MKTRCYDGKKWQYEFKHEGKRYRKKGFRTKREANSAGLDKLNELRSGFNIDNYITLEEYFENWIKTYKQPVVKENTYRHYRNALQHIQKHKIGKMELSKINRQVYQKFINDYSKEHAKETIRKTNGAIRSALDDALYDGLIFKNPAYKVNYKAGKPTKSEQEKFISVTEYEILKDHVRKKRTRSSLALFIMILQNHISQLDSPSMAQVLATIVGGWGSTLVNIGLIISVLGAWLGWTLLAGELPFIVAKDGLFPKWFAKENKNGAPVNALLITNILVQLFLISMLFTQSAYQFAFSLASSAILYPYMFSAFYQVKYTLEHRQQATTKQWTIGIIASIYAIWLIYAAGINYLLLTMLLYIPALLVYSIVQKNNQTRLIKSDYILFMIIIVLAVIGLIKLLMGTINVF